MMMALMPERQTLLMVVAGTFMGIPALTAAWRAVICPVPAWSTWPMSTARYVVVSLFDFTFAPDPLIVGATLIGGAGLSFLIGIAGSWPLLSAKPAQALRSL